MPADWWKRCLAEAIGTFSLTFVGAAAICTDVYSGGQVGLLGIAAAHGLVLAAAVSGIGHVSGGHVNPAVTLGVLLSGGIGPALAALYGLFQLAGAAAAGLLLARTFTADIWQPVHLGAPALGAGVGLGAGILVEAVLTFFLVFTVLQVTVDERAPRHVYGLAIGIVLAFDVLVGGPLTGAAVNPARAFGPALAIGFWVDHVVYWVGPALGALLAAAAFGLLRPAGR